MKRRMAAFLGKALPLIGLLVMALAGSAGSNWS